MASLFSGLLVENILFCAYTLTQLFGFKLSFKPNSKLAKQKAGQDFYKLKTLKVSATNLEIMWVRLFWDYTIAEKKKSKKCNRNLFTVLGTYKY